jgi:membrane fusion protein, heavy metal efflux system
MKMRRAKLAARLLAVTILGLGGALTWVYGSKQLFHFDLTSSANAEREENSDPVAPDQDNVELSEAQLAALKVKPVGMRDFPIEKEAVGTIDFNEDLFVQVFTPYSGRIVNIFGKTGEDLHKGDILFTIDSPDLLQAESSLISAAGVLKLAARNLQRQQQLVKTSAATEKALDQAASDEQTAEGALHTARDALRVFGKTDDDIDHIIAQRLADSILVVRSPIDGRITARNASPGLFVQPGNAPAPYTVSNIETMWMIANVPETDSPAFQIGQPVKVSVNAFPGRVFDGKITLVDAMVDPKTRRVTVRSEVQNKKHELRSGMFANFIIRTSDPVKSLAVPIDGVVREGDGTMSVWVAVDKHRFRRRTVQTGQMHDGYWQILSGLEFGEPVAVEGALFLSNTVTAAAQ